LTLSSSKITKLLPDQSYFQSFSTSDNSKVAIFSLYIPPNQNALLEIHKCAGQITHYFSKNLTTEGKPAWEPVVDKATKFGAEKLLVKEQEGDLFLVVELVQFEEINE